MFGKLILPVLAGSFLMFGASYAVYNQQPEADPPPPVPPPTSPFGHTVAGAGMVEPNNHASGSSAVAAGSQVAGVVARVLVTIGQEVKAGAVLLELDARQAHADLRVREARVPVNEAQVRAAEATLQTQRDQWERDKRLSGTQLAEQDRFAHTQCYFNAVAQLALAKANLDLARAQVAQGSTTVELLQVRAASDGTILQINVRPGEYVTTSAGQSLVLMGNLEPLHVRVNVDEEDLPRLRLDAPARAKIRGAATQEAVVLRFVRLEPFVAPKMSLTGANTERVDTRVVQLIYAVEPGGRLVREKKLMVGLLLDVFIDARSVEGDQ
jgi:HlyD family secretion protein